MTTSSRTRTPSSSARKASASGPDWKSGQLLIIVTADEDNKDGVNDIPMMWRSRPSQWPGLDLLPLLIQLREGFPC